MDFVLCDSQDRILLILVADGDAFPYKRLLVLWANTRLRSQKKKDARKDSQTASI